MADLDTQPWLPGTARWPRAAITQASTGLRDRQLGIALMATALVPLLALLPTGLMALMVANCGAVMGLALWGVTGRGWRVLIGVLPSICIAGASFSGWASSMQQVAIAYAALMLALKTMELGSARDLRVIAILALLPVLVGLTSGATPLSMVSCLVIVPASLALLVHACDREAGQNATRGAAWRYPGQGVAYLAMSLPLALLLFFLLPRMDSPLWGRPQASARTGMSDTMAPGGFNRLLNDPSLAFMAFFDDPLPVGFQPYWRAVVLTQFDGTTWSIHNATDEAQGNSAGTGKAVAYTMQIEPQQAGYLPVLDVPLAAPDGQGTLRRDLTVFSRGRWDRGRSIRFIAALNGQNQAPLGPMERQANLDLPDGYNPKSIALAKRLREQARDEADFIRRVGAFFDQQLTYTLEPPLLGRNRVDELLFQTRLGLCEHFASAFVVMMRAGGVPARVVTGYQGGELNDKRDQYLVRQLYAHAWAEVWREGQGWRRIDPTTFVTSQRPINTGIQNPVLRTAGAAGLVRWLKDGWRNTIGEFDARSQRYIAYQLLSVRKQQHNWDNLGVWMMRIGGGLIIAALLAILAAMSLQRRNRIAVDVLESAWQQACRRLAKRAGGGANLTPRQASEVAKRALAPKHANPFALLARRYAQAQYAPEGSGVQRWRLALELKRWRP